MPEHQPGEPASATGLYHEVNVFGSPTGRIVRPSAASGCLLRRAVLGGA